MLWGGNPEATYEECYTRVLGPPIYEGSQLAFACPWPGCIGYEKKRLYVNPENGRWQCKRCRQVVFGKEYSVNSVEPHGGNWHDFLKLWNHYFPENREDPRDWPAGEVEYRPERPKPLRLGVAQEYWTELFGEGKLRSYHEATMLERGIDPYDAGLISSDPERWNAFVRKHGEELAIQAGLAQRVREKFGPSLSNRFNRIIIPFWKPDGTLRYFVGYAPPPERENFDTDEAYDYVRNNMVKYALPSGYTPQFYGDIPYSAPYAIITEGPLKAIAARQNRLIAIGMNGMASSHLSIARYCKSRKVKRALIIFDTERDMEDIDYEAGNLALHLLDHGLDAYRVRLPLEGHKTDLDSFLLNHPVEELKELMRGARRYRKPAG